MIADDARMIIFYSIENNSEYKSLQISDIRYTDENSEELQAAVSYAYIPDKGKEKRIQDHLKISFVPDTEIPAGVHLALRLHEIEPLTGAILQELPYVWQLDIPIDKSRFENLKQVYPVGKTVEIEGQRITVGKTTVSPTRIAVSLSLSENNSMHIFYFENARLLNEKGEILSTLMNDMIASYPGDNQMILYFESNYFSDSQSLYLSLDGFRALDKDKTEIVIDYCKEKLLQAPDEKLQLKEILQAEKETTIKFLYKDTNLTPQQQLSFMSVAKIVDHTGKELNLTALGTFYSADAYPDRHFSATFEHGSDYEDPLRIVLSDYPNRIKGNETIQLK
jgi:hypothetical protein